MSSKRFSQRSKKPKLFLKPKSPKLHPLYLTLISPLLTQWSRTKTCPPPYLETPPTRPQSRGLHEDIELEIQEMRAAATFRATSRLGAAVFRLLGSLGAWNRTQVSETSVYLLS